MRIISKFKDYYDRVQKLGQSVDTSYLRKAIRCVNPEFVGYTPPTVKYPHDKISLPEGLEQFKQLETIIDFCNSIPADSVLKPSRWNNTHFSTPEYTYGQPPWLYHQVFNKEICFSIIRGLIFFCGEVIPLLAICKYKKDTLDKTVDFSNPTYIYDIQQFDSLLKNNNIELDKENYNLITCWLSDKKHINTNILISNKIINLLVIGLDRYRRRYGKNTLKIYNILDLIINPRLSDLQFQKKYEANTAFQKLDSCICGTLAYPQNELIEVSNEQKILKHGFDPIYGFRKRKE